MFANMFSLNTHVVFSAIGITEKNDILVLLGIVLVNLKKKLLLPACA